MSEHLQIDHDVFGLAHKSFKFVKLTTVYSYGVIKTA